MTDSMIGVDGHKAPDFTTPIVGFRYWKLTAAGSLLSPHVERTRWDEAELRAECRTRDGSRRRDHEAPHHGCTCGLYAYYTELALAPEALEAGYVTGAVAVAGRIEIHSDGLRAETMRCLALVGDGIQTKLALGMAANRIGVSVVSNAELGMLAREHGEPVPAQVVDRVREHNAKLEAGRAERRAAAGDEEQARRAAIRRRLREQWLGSPDQSQPPDRT